MFDQRSTVLSDRLTDFIKYEYPVFTFGKESSLACEGRDAVEDAIPLRNSLPDLDVIPSTYFKEIDGKNLQVITQKPHYSRSMDCPPIINCKEESPHRS